MKTSFLHRLFGRKQAPASAGASISQSELMSMGPVKSFTPDAELRLYQSWMYIAAAKNATAIASTPLRLYTRVTPPDDSQGRLRRLNGPEKRSLASRSEKIANLAASDDISEVTDHPFLDLMKQVNGFRNQFDFLEETSISLDITGNCFWNVITGAGLLRGIPTALWILPSHLTSIIPDQKKFIAGYKFGADPVNKQILLPRQVVHHRRPGLRDQLYGMSRIEGAFNAAHGSVSMDRYENALNDNRAIPDLVVKYKGRLGRSEKRRVLREWNHQTGSIGSAGGALVADEDFDIQPLNLSPKELNYLEGRKWRREEILNAFGQSLALYTETANRANVEGAIYLWAKFELDPSCRRIAEKINESLIPLYDDSGNLFTAFDAISTRDKDFVLKQESEDRKNNVRAINEIRIARGLDPIDDERANDPFFSAPVAKGSPDVATPVEPVAPARSFRPKQTNGNGAHRFNGRIVHPELDGVELSM